MKRLLTVSALVGVVGAAVVAWEARDSVAYAAVEAPQRCSDQEHLAAIAEGCAKGLGRFEAKLQGGVIVGSCAPNLGVVSVPKGRR